MMDSSMQLFPFLLSLFLILHLSGKRVLQAEALLQHQQLNDQQTKLFVFGDSYADTGNIKKGLANSWKDPYGVTFPGKPAGRFSDGRILTDYIAKYLKVKSPVPYKLRKLMPQQHLKNGMNFAFGGTGVFDTLIPGPNMTTQIDLLQKVIKHKVYTASDINNSVALVSVAGNDYTRYLTKNGSAEGLPAFVSAVINQTTTDLIRIKGLGTKKVVVCNLQPVGCLPQMTATSSFQHCNDTSNNLVLLHNNLLNQAVTTLNQQTKDRSSPFLVLNLYESFMSVLNHPSTHHIQNQFKPCCVGVSSEYFCGSVDKNNVKKYTICEEPKSAFFWDLVHPTEAGWHAVYNKLGTMNALQQIHDH